ncbi:hypothetical protein BDZ89DRAFT_1040819 [Hymenopellis radicata]|nr:hypothetical protein BDZ89DRAFT_1040819 [Hymenopellis radicata]
MPPRRRRDIMNDNGHNNQAADESHPVQLDPVTTGIDAPAPQPRPRQAQRKTKPKKAKRPIKLTGFAMQSPDGGWYNYKGRCPAPVMNDARRTTDGSPSQPPSEAHYSVAESPSNSTSSHVGDANRTNEPGSLSGEPHSRSVGFDARGNSYYTLPPHLQHAQHIQHPFPMQAPTTEFASNSNIRVPPPRLNPASMVQQPLEPIYSRGMEYKIQHAPDYVPQNSRFGSSASSAFGVMIPYLQTGHSDSATTLGGNVTAQHNAAAALPNSYPHLPPRDYHLHHRSLYDANAIRPGIDAIPLAQQFSGPRYAQPSQYHANALSHPTNYISMGRQREVQGDLHQPPIQYTSAGHTSTALATVPPPVIQDLILPQLKRKRTESFSDLGETDEAKKMKLGLGSNDDSDFESGDVFNGRFEPLNPFPDEVETSTGDESFLGELLADDSLSEGYLSEPGTSESSFGLETPEPDSEPDDDVPRQEKQKQNPEEAELDFDVDGWFAPVDFGFDDIDGWAGIL